MVPNDRDHLKKNDKYLNRLRWKVWVFKPIHKA